MKLRKPTSLGRGTTGWNYMYFGVCLYSSGIMLGLVLFGREVKLLKLETTLNCRVGLVIHCLLLFLPIWKTVLFNKQIL